MVGKETATKTPVFKTCQHQDWHCQENMFCKHLVCTVFGSVKAKQGGGKISGNLLAQYHFCSGVSISISLGRCFVSMGR